MSIKYCSCCRKTRPTRVFGFNKGRADGLADYCRDCARKASLEEYYSHKEEYREYKQEYNRRPTERYRQICRRSQKRGIPMAISKQDFITWYNEQPQNCFYCGVEFDDYKNNHLRGLTMDRIDNDKQYELDNIVLSCMRCNIMKGSWLSGKQMLDAANRYFKTEPLIGKDADILV